MHSALEMDEFDRKDFTYSCVSTWMGEIMPIHKNLDFGIMLLAFCGKSWHCSFLYTKDLIMRG